MDDDLVIGYTSSGGYSHSRGHSVGIGCCTIKGLYEVYKNKALVMIRTSKGRKSHVCSIQPCE